MMKVGLLIIIGAFFIVAAWGCNHWEKKRRTPPNDYLTVVLNNKTDFPIRVISRRSYDNLDDYYKTSQLRMDTLYLPLKGYEYVRFSHGNTSEESILVGQGDTLYLDGENNVIHHETCHWSDSIRRFEAKLAEFFNGGYRELSAKMNTIISRFKRVDSAAKPMRIHGDYHQFEMRLIQKASEEEFEEGKADIDRYYALAKNQYEHTVQFLDSLSEWYPVPLVEAKRYEVEYAYFNKLQIFDGLDPNFDTAVIERMGGDFYHRDNIMNHSHVDELLGWYIAKRMMKGKLDRSRSRIYMDFKPAYNEAPRHFGDSVAKYVRFLCLERMVDNQEAFGNIEAMYLEFKETYQDGRLNGILESKYLFDTKRYRDIAEDLVLVDGNRKIVSFSELLEHSAGKLVYVDLWASWCGPCRDAMPASHLLRREYRSEPVVFMYVSTDQDAQAWTRAATVEKLADRSQSYLLVNQESSDFIKQIGLTAIPRYLLFDKHGRLVHQDAPGPKGEAIRELLGEYLGD